MVTRAEYTGLDQAYGFFNAKLFGGRLPPLMITLHRRANSKGYFSAKRFGQREGADIVHELALNPDTFKGRTDEQILSTLVHEMTHAWQHEYGKPSRRSYHNREWAAKMKEIGLQPSETGEPGGRETGQLVTHYIVSGGRFQIAAKELLDNGFALHWQSQQSKGPARESKTKFTCPTCAQNAWGKPGSQLICGVCYRETGEIQEMAGRRG